MRTTEKRGKLWSVLAWFPQLKNLVVHKKNLNSEIMNRGRDCSRVSYAVFDHDVVPYVPMSGGGTVTGIRYKEGLHLTCQ